jgi:hypothetical protein
MSKPPITVKCECGQSRELAYRERWQCDCGRTWNTGQIPAAEYEGLLRRVKRAKLEAVVVAALGAAVLVPLIAFASPRFIGLVPLAAAFWLFFYLPRWRRKVRATARDAPRWELHPE